MPQQKRILIIDDEDDIREVAKTSLEIVAGWEVATACSGPDGLAQAVDRCPDAILLDVMMPDMDGPSTFQKLQAHPATRAIPVIFLTAKVQSPDRRRLGALGVTATIAKPFDPLKLAADVARVLGWDAEEVLNPGR